MAKASGPQRPRRRFGRVRKLPSLRYQAGYLAPDSSVIYAEQTFPTKAMADRFRVLTEAEMMSGTWMPPERRRETVGEWAERWLASGHAWKPKTRVDYEMRVRVYVEPRWGTREITSITRAEVRDWVAELIEDGSKPSTVRHAVGTLSRVVSLAVEDGVLNANPCDRVRLPRLPSAGVRPLTPSEVERLAKALPEYALLIRTAAWTGLRAAELCGLRAKRVDLDRRVLEVTETLSEAGGHLYVVPPKTYQSRSVPIPSPLAAQLRDYLAAQGGDPERYVFTVPTGQPIRWRNFSKLFHAAAVAVNLPDLRFHDLRHTNAALLIAEGAHPRSVMERLGHSSITVTLNVYGKAWELQQVNEEALLA